MRTTVCASPKPGDDLNAAIKACPEGQVVKLAAGTYTVSSTVTLNKGVVLRGAGSQGAAKGGTTIVKTGGNSALAIGTGQDTACYDSALRHRLCADGGRREGDDARCTIGRQRQQVRGRRHRAHRPGRRRHRAGGRLPVLQARRQALGRASASRSPSVDAAAGTLTLSSPLHWTFQSASPHIAQIAKTSAAVVRWAGIESLAIQGGTNPGYDGQMAGGIDVSNAAYCWIKDVQTDGTIGGMHVALTGTYRTVVRDSLPPQLGQLRLRHRLLRHRPALRRRRQPGREQHRPLHEQADPVQRVGRRQRHRLQLRRQLVGDPPAWQEVNIDTHCSFPHMELMEGNYAPHMGATITHGNAGYMTFFRNYSSSQFAAARRSRARRTSRPEHHRAAVRTGDIDMTVIGNVFGSAAATDLGTAPLSKNYIADGSESGAIFDFGSGGKSDISYKSLWAPTITTL